MIPISLAVFKSKRHEKNVTISFVLKAEVSSGKRPVLEVQAVL